MTEVEIKPLLVEISDNAISQIKATLDAQEHQNLFLRIYVQGGCGGLGYGMALDNRGVDGDTEIDVSGVRVVVDKNSLSYVNGATVDFDTNEGKSGFKISNPNAEAMMQGGGCASGSCGTGGGCGSGSGGCC